MTTVPTKKSRSIYTKQTAFNRIWNFFVVQKNKPARRIHGGCVYSPVPDNGNNCGCAIGCLLNKKEQKAMDANSIGGIGYLYDEAQSKKVLVGVKKKLSGEPLKYWRSLQLAHDESSDLERTFRTFAAEHNLTIPA